MSVSIDPDGGDIIFSGFEQGIGLSPHKGLGNLQNINLNTLTGEALISFGRVQDTMTNSITTGNLAFVDSSHVSLSIAGTNNLFKGNWITVTNSSNTGELPNGTYYVPPSTGANFQLSKYYNDGISQPPVTISTLIVGGGAGGGSGIGGSGSAGQAGGGGGGGQVINTTVSIIQQSYSIVVGAGGAVHTNGSLSSFDSMTAIGGGAGGTELSSAPLTGASGGGGFGSGTSTANPGATGTAGNNGGNGFSTSTAGAVAAGGGGGFSSAGGNGTSAQGGVGGNGTAPTVGAETLGIMGAGGGGGSVGTGGGIQIGSSAGVGGGLTTGGSSAGANSGSGGGGGGAAVSGSTVYAGGTGGSGMVVIAAPVNSFVSVVVTGGTHTTSGGYDYWTFLTGTGTWFPTLKTVSNNPFLTGFTAGLTANFTMVATIGKPIASATETYLNNGIVYHRYYILDNKNLVWAYDDQNEVTYSASDNVSWFLPDFNTNWCTSASGIAVISGWLMATASDGVFAKPVVQLGNTASATTTWTQLPDVEGWSGAGFSTAIPHFCLTAHDYHLYITDASYLIDIFPDSALADPGNSTSNNVQTLCSWVETAATIGEYSIISGVSPVTSDGKRLPVVFFTEPDGTLPTAISANSIYYIAANAASQNFQVYAASTGGSALDLLDGASGVQYFNSFYPILQIADIPTYVLTDPVLALPTFEISQCMAEIGTTVIIGCRSNILYPWPEQGTQASDAIFLPEANVVNMVTVHQMAYVFAGNKGNIYETEGQTTSLAMTIPDYCAGISGSPETYIDPYFVWQSAMYLRGRLYFSVLDQTPSKIGNCGGVWSLIPTQDFFIGQDVGTSLRLENQNSYGNYSGAASVLIPKLNQAAISPQYFSGWFSDVTTPTYGIDSTGTFPTQTAILETELIPTGTILGQQKKTFTSEEYKLSSPLLSGESVQLNYRLDLTDSWNTCGAVNTDNSNISGYFPINFQNSQWVQFQAVLTANGTSTFSGNRLTEIRLHPSKYESN